MKTIFYKYKSVSLMLAAITFLCSCSGKKEEGVSFKRFIMGAPASITVYGADEKTANAAAKAIFAEWARLDREYSYTDPYSTLSYVNRKAITDWVEVDREFFSFLKQALDFYKMTNGSFDVTFAPLWEVWKKSAKVGVMPEKAEIDAALAQVGFSAVTLNHVRRAVRFSKPVQLNLAGLIRGYALLRVKRMLEKMFPDPHPAILMDLGGDILAFGRTKRPWELEIKNPLRSKRRLGRVIFDEGAILTTGSYERYVEIADKRYCHILDLKTGYPLENFSSLTIYLPSLEDIPFPSVVPALMGKEAAFKAVAGITGAFGVWVDADGRVETVLGPGTGARWQTASRFGF
ncbi:MAG: FAD:protein FMN transferase [bacterium]